MGTEIKPDTFFLPIEQMNLHDPVESLEAVTTRLRWLRRRSNNLGSGIISHIREASVGGLVATAIGVGAATIIPLEQQLFAGATGLAFGTSIGWSFKAGFSALRAITERSTINAELSGLTAGLAHMLTSIHLAQLDRS